MANLPHIALLLESLDRAFDLSSWHGPNLASSIRGLSAEEVAQALLGRKSIWQQTLHAAYWKQRVLNKLIGTQKFPRAGSNWPSMPQSLTEKNWKADRDLLHDIHRRLRHAVAALPQKRLDPATRKLILGAAAHDLYHAGQINLLRRMIRSR